MADPGPPGSGGIDRRDLLKAGGLLGLAGVLGTGVIAEVAVASRVATPSGPAGGARSYRWMALSAHEASVVEEAAARLIPGPTDDAAEAGHPGAREAGVVYYIDGLLGALTAATPKVFAGGPFSNRHGSPTDEMARFLHLTPVQHRAWAERVASLRREYAAGVAALDAAGGGDFIGAGPEQQDRILARDPGGFTTLLFGHAIEGMYSNPEYGGNRNEVGWRDIGFPGDSQPHGYKPAQVDAPGVTDPYLPVGVAAALLDLLRASSGV
ncbi:MAG TPA: gluconate 2-dehydrogenase subunit 3 family protein [Acidimicrobiales bacterium]|nr:gluconate 2-dehydrogenase subunit 3 family protein [Acidimicrobiales bacterium]